MSRAARMISGGTTVGAAADTATSPGHNQTFAGASYDQLADELRQRSEDVKDQPLAQVVASRFRAAR